MLIRISPSDSMRSLYAVFSCDDLTRTPGPDDPDNCVPQIGIKSTIPSIREAQQQFVSSPHARLLQNNG